MPMPSPSPAPDPSRTLADLVSDDYEHIVVACCGWIHHVQIGPHAHARPDQTGALFAARLVCRKCGKRPEDYRIERSPTYGYTADLSNLLSYRSRRD